MVGMRDVARKAGVSLSTVSLVVNDTGYVSQDMHDRVMQAVKDLGYIPKKKLHRADAQRSGLVGVLLPTLNHPFFASLASEIHKQLVTIDEVPVTLGVEQMPGAETVLLDMLRHKKLDGLITCSHAEDESSVAALEAPIVAFDRFIDPSIPIVQSDWLQAARLVCTQLLDSGAKRVVEMGGPRSQFRDIPIDSQGNDTSFPTTHYHRALEEELASHGVRVDYVQVDHVAQLPLFSKAAVAAFESFPRLDAIIAPDMAAAYSVQQALKRGLKIPQDVQIMSFDGTLVADAAGLRITTVRQNVGMLSHSLVHLLAEEMQYDGKRRDRRAERKVIPVRLIKGDTTR
ncbi:LacI family DNA-binding transcriptional regulator [Pseudoscardovia suis]|uniref:LacI family transcriptional regulator n=1 Tax=Pseudoscardovia suis TaxID=987063 RepID=A0A261EX47_9BIFI|nr:LacI family DNA-binding transcriptional regulator [Pseudoscardovia suis]OZG51432.1 LacI family transcriptional regulator [Pseudoscardovia suis]PJJ68685.1 LacI family sucrose operon transcriptional repressor [Pseudoscardovia suis]